MSNLKLAALIWLLFSLIVTAGASYALVYENDTLLRNLLLSAPVGAIVFYSLVVPLLVFFRR
jgi:hypothetical protein